MAAKPSVKGSLIAATMEEVHKRVDAGEISRAQLEARLRPEDLALLEEPVNVSQWYDLEFYERLAELLYDLEGGPREAYFQKKGFARGQKLMEAGLYQQMEYVGRSGAARRDLDPEARFKAYGRDLKLFVTLSSAILNFSRWSVARDPDHDDRYRIEVRDAATFPDFLGWGSAGLMNAMSSPRSPRELWRYERIAPDFVVFRMLEPV